MLPRQIGLIYAAGTTVQRVIDLLRLATAVQDCDPLRTVKLYLPLEVGMVCRKLQCSTPLMA